MDEKIIYRLNDDISFRKCSLFQSKKTNQGNCTNFGDCEENYKTYHSCYQDGIHLHCTNHPEIEFDTERPYGNTTLFCPKCNKGITVNNFNEIIKKCLRMANIEEFKDAKLVRLDDWYVPEIKKKEKVSSDYWIETNVKTDKDGDTIIIVYVGNYGSKEKAQFFIKPEKCQLTNDHKDLDPAKILSKIEVILKNRTLTHIFD